MSAKTDWAYHRANFAQRHPTLTAKDYALRHALNPNTARVRLQGALEDERALALDLSGVDHAAARDRSREKAPPKPAKTITPKKAAAKRSRALEEEPKKKPVNSKASSGSTDRGAGTRQGGPAKKTGNEKVQSADRARDRSRGTDPATGTDHAPPARATPVRGSKRKNKVVDNFELPEVGETWAAFNKDGFVAWQNLPPEIQSEATALSNGDEFLALRIGRLMQMYEAQADMMARIRETYGPKGGPEGATTMYMADGQPMPREMAVSQALFGPAQRMTELENGIAKMREEALSRHPWSKARQVAYTNRTMRRRREEGLTAVETAALLEEFGVEVPKILAAEAAREISLMEARVESGGGVTDAELAEASRSYMAKLAYQTGTWEAERNQKLSAMFAEEVANQNRSLLSEDDFNGAPPPLAPPPLAQEEEGPPLTEFEDVLEEWPSGAN